MPCTTTFSKETEFRRQHSITEIRSKKIFLNIIPFAKSMKATSLLQIKTSKKVVLTMELVITYDILMQGHSRRLLVQVKPVQNSGTLPIICESIQHVSIGCVCARSKLQKGA